MAIAKQYPPHAKTIAAEASRTDAIHVPDIARSGLHVDDAALYAEARRQAGPVPRPSASMRAVA